MQNKVKQEAAFNFVGEQGVVIAKLDLDYEKDYSDTLNGRHGPDPGPGAETGAAPS